MSPEDFKRLVAAGLSTDQIALVMEMMERDSEAYRDADEARRNKARERVAKWRERHGNISETQQKVTERLAGESARVEDKTSSSEIEPLSNKQAKAHERSEFDDWYAGYPHKVQRGAAERAFPAARRLASLDELKAGLARYVASKPPDRQWQNPATWLNGKGWLDNPAPLATPSARAGPSPRPNPALDAADALMEKFDAISPSQTEGHPPYPRLVVLPSR